MKQFIIKIGYLSLSWILIASYMTCTVEAAQTLTILSGNPGEGSHEFAIELARLWQAPSLQTEGQLHVATEPNPRFRLEKLLARQANLAILNAQQAYTLLPDYPQLRVLTLLWPNLLYVLGRHAEIKHLEPAIHQTLRLHTNSFYFVQSWLKLAKQAKITPSITWFDRPDFLNVDSLLKTDRISRQRPLLAKDSGQPSQNSPIASAINIEQEPAASNPRDPFIEDVLMVTGPYVLRELDLLLRSDSEFRLLDLSTKIQNMLTKEVPWIRIYTLPANTYFGMSEPLQLPVQYPVLIGRADISSDWVALLLQVIYEQRKAINPHVLFQHLDAKQNKEFQQYYHFHPTSQSYFKF
ncbi:hypothetical protein WDW89_13365 [Deltaproteobacteria bacterium TL4]